MLGNYLESVTHNCKLKLVTERNNLKGNQYIQNTLESVVVIPFDKHVLATEPVYMDDNVRSNRSVNIVAAYFHSSAVTTLSWPTMSPDFWDRIGRRMHAFDSPIFSKIESSITAGVATVVLLANPMFQ